MSLVIREGAATPLDFFLTYKDENEQEQPYAIGAQRVLVIFVDKNENVRKIYDSAKEHTRMAVEPEGRTGLVRVFPKDDSIRAAWSPYKVFIWVGQASGWAHSFPPDREFTVTVLPAYGTESLI